MQWWRKKKTTACANYWPCMEIQKPSRTRTLPRGHVDKLYTVQRNLYNHPLYSKGFDNLQHLGFDQTQSCHRFIPKQKLKMLILPACPPPAGMSSVLICSRSNFSQMLLLLWQEGIWGFTMTVRKLVRAATCCGMLSRCSTTCSQRLGTRLSFMFWGIF